MKNHFFTFSLILLLGNNLWADHGHHRGRHMHHHHACDTTAGNPQKISYIYKTRINGDEYQFIFLTDSTVKVNNDATFPVKTIGRGTCIVNWTDKNSIVLSNVIDRHRMKVYTIRLDKDKAIILLTSPLSMETKAEA